MLQGAGQQQRGMAQQNLDTAYQDFLAQRGYPVEQLKILQSGLTGLPNVQSSTATQTTPGQGFLGSAGDIAGVLGYYGFIAEIVVPRKNFSKDGKTYTCSWGDYYIDYVYGDDLEQVAEHALEVVKELADGDILR